MVKIEPSHGARTSGGHLPLHTVLDEQLVIQNQNSQARIQVLEGEDEPCPICGDKNTGYHYGIRTCESCKVSSYYYEILKLYFLKLVSTWILLFKKIIVPRY